MISAAQARLRAKGFGRVALCYGKDWELDEEPDARLGTDAYFYHGSARQRATLLRSMCDYSHMYMTGADVIDGAYNPPSVRRRLQLLNDFSKAGGRSTVLGSSYNEAPERTTLAALRGLDAKVTICARDPVSRSRMERQLERPIRQVADLAFLLPPRSDLPEVREGLGWISMQRRAGRPVIAVNVNYLQVQKTPSLVASIALVMTRLANEGVSIICVPHDFRTDASDGYHLEEVGRLAGGPGEQVVQFASRSPGAVKALLGAVDVLVTGRLHALILALSSGTPCVGMSYQGKFEGLLDLFQISAADTLLTPAEFVDAPGRLYNMAMRLLCSSGDRREHLLEHVPGVTRLAEANFDE